MSGGAMGRLSRKPRFALAGVRVRLEMFLSALFGTPIPVVAHGAAGASELALARRAWAIAPARRRTLVVRYGRSASLPAAGAAVDDRRAGGDQPLPPPRRATGRTAGSSHAADVRPDTAPRGRTLVPAGGSRRDRLLDRRRAARAGAGAGRGACARARPTGASSHVHAGRGVRTRGARVPCRRSR